jgi:hypothetical protein
VGALSSTDKRIKYAAAEAIVRSSTGSEVPMLASVVDVLAQAVTEEMVNTIHMIMPDAASRAVGEVATAERSKVYTSSGTAIRGQLTLMGNPSIDVVVVNEILPDALPEDVMATSVRMVAWTTRRSLLSPRMSRLLPSASATM